jgi:uncharacterized integral membrane protein
MSTDTLPTSDPTDAGSPVAGGSDEHLAKPTGSRTNAAMWFAILGAVVLAVLLVFILQNLDRVPIEFLGFSGEVPVGVAMLLSAIAGGLIVAIAAGARILQLRRRATGWKR